MAHFAELDGNNIVLRVMVVDDQHEADGENWCNNFFGDGIWKQTSYNETIRKNYAGIGFIYDETRDAFIPISPFNSWVLNEDTCKWESPIPYPDDDKNYTWNEDIINWASVTE
jgi:hypothetical protein